MAAAAEELDVDGIRVRVTNPDRVYFPQLGSGGTKRRLVEYYLAVGRARCWLRFATGPRICSASRRHRRRGDLSKAGAQHHPDYLQTCRVTFPSGRTADALKVTHPAAIVWAAQMGTVTLHPWQVRCPDTEHPDELRIDLDPQPGTGFAQARAVAVDVLRPLLDELGLVGYPKTSGGRGVHVFLRIATDWDFIQVRRAGIALARELERRAPGAVTTSWWKEQRGARIFVDFNQNARDRTMASAYSVRPTPIATVSTPLTWDELAGADPDDYTIATVPDLVAGREDPWAGMDDVAQSIAPLIDLAAADDERGLGDLPYPPNYPKMPGEPKRVQPSRDTDLKRDTKG
ncbi:eukaryotic and archaeal DNA primase small subunit [Mycobacterium kansasii 662]|uniref:Eukaryotic and archaeal DNA primase small subunit n=1 Tax=Mycobacterium kansasii 662 TaxID=1299326 RepID=X7ZCK4_MYCKA|nr:eukaryotic and archaeal DNA primase small subunit [Mycobacterium kansasii 662]